MGQLLFGLLGSLTSSVFLSVKEGLQACCNKDVFTSICTKHAVHREHDGVVQFQTWNQAQVSCSLNAQFSVHFALLYSRLVILLLLSCFALPAQLPIHSTTAIFSASTGRSQHVASSPVHEDQTIDHMWVFLLLCLVPSSYSSVFILLPHAQNICEHYLITFYLV